MGPDHGGSDESWSDAVYDGGQKSIKRRKTKKRKNLDEVQLQVSDENEQKSESKTSEAKQDEVADFKDDEE